MKNKFIIFFIALVILALALTGYKLIKSESDNGATITKLRSSGAQNNLIIERIQNSTNNPVSQEYVLVTLRTEWNGLYFETNSTSTSPSSLTSEEKLQIIKQSITPQEFINNLVPEIDEATTETGLGIGPETSGVNARRYVVQSPKTTSPIYFTVNDLINDSGTVYEAIDPTTKYDFVFVVEANDATTNTNVKNSLSEFTTYLNTNNYDYRTNIIEIGGKKAIYKEVGTTGKYNIQDSTGVSVITTSNSNNNYSKSSSYSLLYSNMDKTKVSYPQDVYFTDGLYPTSTSSEFYIQRYSNWLSSANLSTAISLIGKYNLTGSTYKTPSGSNGLYGLYEAISFLNTTKDSSRKQVIVYIGNKEMNSDITTVKGIPQFSNITATTDADAKIAFTNWFNTQIATNNFLVLNSTPFSNSSTFDSNPYTTVNIDRLGHTIAGTYTKLDNKLYLLGLKNQLLDKLYEYESGTNQTYLKDTLYNFIGRGRYYQKWYLKYTVTTPAVDKWKKLLFSLGDFKINYDDGNNSTVKTTTVLKKPMSEADLNFYPGKSTDILAINPTEKYYDRYYYTNGNPTIITFTNPNENNPIWYPDSQQNYILNFNFSKANTTNVLPDGTALTSLKLEIKNGTNTILNKTYTRADIVQKETSLGGWGLTTSKDKYLVSVYFSDLEFKSLQDAVKASRNYHLTFDVTGTINNELVQKSVTTYVDIIGPEIVGSATAHNQSAKAILKALDIFKDDPLEDAYIDAITSNDVNGYLYLRSGSNGSGSDVTFNFTVYDENPTSDTLKYYDTVIHAKIASNFIGQHIVTTYKIDPTDKYVDVGINGQLKTETILRDIEVQDSFGNKSILRIINTTPVFINDPLPLTVNLVDSQINNYTGDSTIDITPKLFVKGGTRDNYDLSFANSTFDSNKIVGLVLPFTQDKSKVDTTTSGTVTDFGRVAKINLNYETFKSATTYPLPTNIIDISGHLDKVNMLSKKNTNLYDGIYGVQNILPVNRAGGIAGFEYNLLLAGATSNADSNVAKLTSPITSLKYVVDTIAPKVKSVYKTAVAFKDGFTIYTNNVDFIVPVVSMQIDSSYPTLTYSDSIFTGNVADKNLDGKPLDIYTIQLDDFSLGTKNINPGSTSAGTNTEANYRFYTYRPTNSNLFTARDLADNINPSAGNIGNLISVYPVINGVSYGTNIKGPSPATENLPNNNFYFTKLMNNLLLHNSFAGAASSSLISGAIGTVTKDYDLPIPTPNFATNGEKLITTYSFNSAGWVKSELKNIVYDTEINTTNKTLPQAILIKTGTNTWEGDIYFGDIYEYAGLTNFSILSGKATNLPIDGTFTVNSSNTITRTETAALNKSDVTKKVSFTYNTTSKIPTDTVSILLTDKLGNTGIFNLKLIITNPLELIGTSVNGNKQIKSTVDINNQHKIIIKGVAEESK